MKKRTYLIYCKDCKVVKCTGDDNYITIGERRYFSKNPLKTCRKCRKDLSLIWDHQPDFGAVMRIYESARMQSKGGEDDSAET